MMLKRVAIGACILAACVLGGLWLFLRYEPAHNNLNAFQQTCIEGQRRAVAGSTQRLDDETEERLLAYCDCVAQQATGQLSEQEIAAIGLGQSTPAIDAKLQAIFSQCRPDDP